MTDGVAGDEWAIRQVVQRYAHAADHADGDAAAALFTTDGVLEVWLDPGRDEPTGRRNGREEIATAIATLCRYDATQHVIANSAVDIDGDRAEGVTHCTAHHVTRDDSGSSDRVMYIRYVDTFARDQGSWLIARRELLVQWISLLPVEST